MMRTAFSTRILTILLLVFGYVELRGSGDPVNVRRRLLECARMPRQDASACLERLKERQGVNADYRRAVSNLLRHFRDETANINGHKDRAALLVFTPDLDLGAFKGRKLRGGPYLLELGVERDGTITSIAPRSKSTGLPVLDQHLGELAKRCVVIPELRAAEYSRCVVTVAFYIDVR